MKKFKTSIVIDGDKIEHYDSIKLVEKIHNHHNFEIVLDYQTVEKLGTHTLDASKKWLGKDIIISFNNYDFIGVITNLELVHDGGFNSRINVSGYSKTILLENGKHLQSWLEKDLTTIVKDVTDQGSIKAAINPAFKEKMEYECQYNETGYQFLQRLASQFDEWLFYDGKKLIFGKPNSQKSAIKLIYGQDLKSLKLGIKTTPHNFSAFSYNALDDKTHSEKTSGKTKGLNELGAHAFKASKDLFKTPTNQHYFGLFDDKAKIEKAIKSKQASAVADNHTIKGESNYQDLCIGAVIKLSATGFKDGNDKATKPYGEYIITEIKHEAGNESYKNKFTAIAASLDVLPKNTNIDFPIAQPQLATVKSNEDPKKKGRVQVQFQWQTGEMKTSWINVLTPNGGKSDSVSTNRGFVFIPEKGDQVMIGFRYNSPSRPFVMGSFFNGKTGAGGSDANKIKSITTRSGSTITFDDNTEKGNILIKDAAGNTVTFNGNDTLSISANGTISLSTGKSMIVLQEDGTINIVGKNINISGSETTSLATKKSTFNTSEKTASVNGQEVNVNAEKKATINSSKETVVSSSAKTSIEGTIVKLN